MVALTYEEARERSRLIDVLGYHVALDVTGGDDVFGSVAADCHRYWEVLTRTSGASSLASRPKRNPVILRRRLGKDGRPYGVATAIFRPHMRSCNGEDRVPVPGLP